jgi:hypothetical protein
VHENEDAVIHRVSEDLRAPVHTAAGFDERVMARVRDAAGVRPAGPGPGAWRWLVRPRTVRVSPLVGLALAAGVCALAVLGGTGARAGLTPAVVTAVTARTGSGPVPLIPTGSGAPAARTVRFTLDAAPTVRSVAVVGDFNDWDPAAAPLVRRADGEWSADVVLPPGRYEYAFLVDGARVVADSTAPRADAADFGAPNSVVTVDGSPR